MTPASAVKWALDNGPLMRAADEATVIGYRAAIQANAFGANQEYVIIIFENAAANKFAMLTQEKATI